MHTVAALPSYKNATNPTNPIKYDHTSGTYPITVGVVSPVSLSNSDKLMLQNNYSSSWSGHLVGGVCPDGFGCEHMIWPNE